MTLTLVVLFCLLASFMLAGCEAALLVRCAR